MTEKTLETFLLRRLRDIGFLAEKISLNNSPGIPDILISRNLKSLMIEIKICNKNTTLEKLFRPSQISYMIQNFGKIKIGCIIDYDGVFIYFEPTKYILREASKRTILDIITTYPNYFECHKISGMINYINEANK